MKLGFVEANGTDFSVGSHFAEYKDGYGVCLGDLKANRNEFMGPHPVTKVTVCLQWTQSGGLWKCSFLANGSERYALDPWKKYKLAVAMDHDGAAVKCIAYDERE